MVVDIFVYPYYHCGMEWKTIMKQLATHRTLQEIADECGLASKGHAHDLTHGRQKTVSYEVGAKIIAMHKRVMRGKK